MPITASGRRAEPLMAGAKDKDAPARIELPVQMPVAIGNSLGNTAFLNWGPPILVGGSHGVNTPIKCGQVRYGRFVASSRIYGRVPVTGRIASVLVSGRFSPGAPGCRSIRNAPLSRSLVLPVRGYTLL